MCRHGQDEPGTPPTHGQLAYPHPLGPNLRLMRETANHRFPPLPPLSQRLRFRPLKSLIHDRQGRSAFLSVRLLGALALRPAFALSSRNFFFRFR